MIKLMSIMNYFAISWMGIAFIAIFMKVIFNIKIKGINQIIAIIISICAIAIYAFNYEPTEFTDLSRLYTTLDNMRYYLTAFYNTGEVVSNILFIIVSRTQYNQLLPFIVATIRYCLFFYIFYQYTKKYNIKKYYSTLFIFMNFAFLTLIESISGIRYYLGITVLFFFLIEDFCFKKGVVKKLLCCVSIFIHTGTSMFVAIRILASESIYKYIKKIRFIIIFWTFFSLKIARILEYLGGKFGKQAAEMLLFYIEEDRTISLRLTLARVSLLLIICLMFLAIKNRDKIEYNSNKIYYNFIEIIILFTFGSIFEAVLFQRNMFFISLISMKLMFSFFQSSFICNRLKKICLICIIILSIGMYMNQIYGVLFGYF